MSEEKQTHVAGTRSLSTNTSPIGEGKVAMTTEQVDAAPSGSESPKNASADLESDKDLVTEGEKSTHGVDFEVGWENDTDPENPQNWSSRKRWSNIFVMSCITFLTPLASSMFAPGIPEVLIDFNTTSNTEATFVVSIFVLGFAFGPIVIAPMSEIYGRMPVYNVCNVLFLIFTIGCALAKNMGMLMAFRFLAGFAGVATVTCGGGTIVDMMPTEKRGGAMALWSLGPLLGPIIGPICGGYLIEGSSNWRWVFWLIALATGIVTIAAYFIMKETYAVVILERKAARLRKSTGNSAYRSKLASDLTPKQFITQSLVRPAKLLFLSPIVSAMCVYVAVMYGLLYILFTTFTFVFTEVYGFSTEGAGLSFIGSGIGTLCGLAYAGIMSDLLIRRKIAAGKTIKPEDRLPFLLTVPASLSLPAGLFIYGWAADKHVHWIVAEIGTAVVGFGMIAILMCIQTYLVDAFPLHAASVTAANAILRSLLGALLPLIGLDLYDAIGLGWGNSLLGFIALALAPVPILFAVFGERIRTNPKARVIL